MKISFIQLIVRKIQGKSYKELINHVGKRLFPLISYNSYYIYEDKNKEEYPFIQPKKDQTLFLNFSSNQTFKKYIDENRISLMDFVERDIEGLFLLGAYAFCAFIDQKLAHITWVAFDEKAKAKIDSWPKKVDWSSEVCWGQAKTCSSFKGLGLYSCVHAQMAKYLKENGFEINKFTVNKNNFPSNKAMNRFQPVVVADGYRIKILFWQFRTSINRL